MLLSCIQHPQSKANIYLRISGIIPTFEKKEKRKKKPFNLKGPRPKYIELLQALSPRALLFLSHKVFNHKAEF